MSIPFSGVVTPQSVAFTAPDGKMHNVTSAHTSFDALKATIKELQVALRSGQDAEAAALHQKLADIAEPARKIIQAGQGRVTVANGVVSYLGTPIHNAISQRILWGLNEGYEMTPYVQFLDNLMDNPSKRAVDELYGFIEKHKLGITDDGEIIAYKKVREDYRDIHSGKFDNSPGQVLEMPRNMVDDDKNRTCSDGFHFCAFDYLPHFGSSRGDKVVIVKVNPRDVVSIPADYNDAKARTCKYVVIGEYEGADLENVLGNKAVWSMSDWSETVEPGIDEDSGECDVCGGNIGFCECTCDDDDYCHECEQDWSDCDCDCEEEDEDEEDEDVSDDDEIVCCGQGCCDHEANMAFIKAPLPTAPQPLIQEAEYVYDMFGAVEKVEVHYTDGAVKVIFGQDGIDDIGLALLAQASTGNKARVRIIKR